MCMTPWQERQQGLPSGALSHIVTRTLDWITSLHWLKETSGDSAQAHQELHLETPLQASSAAK